MKQLWSANKFLSLPKEQQHKKASEVLREIAQNNIDLQDVYNQMCQWLEIELLTSFSPENLSNRFHFHLQLAGVNWQEHNLLNLRQNDKESTVTNLPVAIYLDNLRSAFNVGSILRSVEAFRLGKVYFSPSTPFIDNPKVQKTSMGTYKKVSCQKIDDFQNLPRPFIALETIDFAPSVTNFSFPISFTLFLGNEEYGLSKKILESVDQFIQIPLYGSKNSLNVASAFAIAACAIRK